MWILWVVLVLVIFVGGCAFWKHRVDKKLLKQADELKDSAKEYVKEKLS